MIPYYLLIGTEIMGVIYGKRWQNNTIDKIGDCFSYYVVVEAVSNLIKKTEENSLETISPQISHFDNRYINKYNITALITNDK